VPAVTSRDGPWPSDVIAFDQNWHHLRSTFAGGKDLSLMIPRSMEPEIWMKMLQTLSKKLGAKLPATTCGYSMVKIAVSMKFSQNFLNLKQTQ